MLKNIIENFDIPADDYEYIANTNGLINKSYALCKKDSVENTLFLQQIDHTIFKNIEGLMDNIDIVCKHLKKTTNAPKHLELINTKSGKSYYKTDNGDFWRLYSYINGKTHFRADNKQLAQEAGKMFGDFLFSLSSLDATKLAITLPDFHNIIHRYDQFKDSLKNGSEDRKIKANEYIKVVENNIEFIISIYIETIDTCPLKATHNDTKLSNLIFDDHQKGVCVVDYDTLMPGYIPFDFGDSVRTICSSTIEHDTNLSNTHFDLAIFKPFAESFIDSFHGTLNDQELKMFSKSGIYMSFIMGIRMLTDYLNNDVYYSTNYENHNLDRAANQLTLSISGIESLPEMTKIITS